MGARSRCRRGGKGGRGMSNGPVMPDARWRPKVRSLHPVDQPQHDADVAGGRPAAVLLLKPVEGEAERRRIGDRSAREADERADLPGVVGIDELAAAVET